MKRFQADFFVDYSRFLGTVAGGLSYARLAGTNLQAPMPADAKSDGVKSLDGLEKQCIALGLTTSLISVRRMRAALSLSHTTYEQFHELAIELQGRLRDEMASMVFLSLTPMEADYYEHPLKGWDDVVNKFPSSIVDIEESSKCLSLARNTAAVFHLMRVMEIGLRALGVALNDPNLDPKTNPTWATHLGEMR